MGHWQVWAAVTAEYWQILYAKPPYAVSIRWKLMPQNKTRTAMLAGVAVLLVFGATLLVLKHERTVHFRRLQGAWEGAMHFHWGRFMRTQRVVLKISEQNGSYKASVDEVDLGMKDLPAAQLDFGSKAVNFKLADGFAYHGVLDSDTMEIRGRWKWPGGNYSQPLALTPTNTPDTVQEPLAETDYTPRAGSDLQGLWAGTLNADKPLKLVLKIAEAADGTFRAELNSIDQPPVVPLPMTFLNYQQPQVKIRFQGIGAQFEGELNEGHSSMKGTWTQAKIFAMTFDRVDPKGQETAEAVAPKKEAAN
jgi:hypothetical protein